MCLDFSDLNDSIVTSEEVILFQLIFFERLQVQAQSSCFLEGTSKEEVSRIRSYLQDAISYWIGIINQIVHGDSSTIQLQETKMALLWGIISCYPYMTDIQADSSLLLDFVNAIDQLLVIDCGKACCPVLLRSWPLLPQYLISFCSILF